MTASYGPLPIWLTIVVIGVLTFGIRFSFIYLFGHIDAVPPRLKGALKYVPPAVLAALVVPSLVQIHATPMATLTDDRLVAGAVAALAAWRTENMLGTIAAGMGTLWTLRFVL